MEKYQMEYQELESFLIEELEKFSHGELKPFCEKHNLSYKELSRFRKKKMPTTRPFFLQDILKALGYEEITMQQKMFFGFVKKEAVEENYPDDPGPFVQALFDDIDQGLF